MRIEAVELRRVRMPLVAPFRSSEGTVAERDVLLVRVLADGAEGWGECAALPEPTYTAEYADGAADVLRRHLVPRLLGGVDLDTVAGHPMAKAALRTAVLDARLRIEQRSLASYLGASRTRVPVGAAVGIPASGDTAELRDTVAELVARGYHRIKVKIEPGWDAAPVEAVRAQHPDVPLWVDANGAYHDAGALRALDDFGLDCIEQPLPAADLLGHAAVASSLRTPVALDESIASLDDALAAVALHACALISVKPARVGGVEEARRLHDAAPCAMWVGGMLETGIGRAAVLAVAALPGFVLAGELSASDRYYAEDLTEPFVLDGDGCLAVPDGPGIGVAPDPGLLAARTTAVELLG